MLMNKHIVLEMRRLPKKQEDEMTTSAPETQQPATTDDFVYPEGWRLALIMTAIFTGMLLVALVRSK